MNNNFVIGDIHGCFDEIQLLLDKAGASLSRHNIYLVGDLINKGPKSFKVLNWVRDHGIPAVIGNHEIRFIEGIHDKKSMSPRLKELKSQMKQDLNLWIGWLDSFPKYLETKDFFIVHGGFVPGEAPVKTPRKVLANIRTWQGDYRQLYQPSAKPWHSFYNKEKPVFYGHWATQGLHISRNTYCLDSGCVYGKFLTGIWTDSKDMIHVPAKKIYCPI